MHFTWRNFEEKEPINRGELFIELERFIFPLIFITKREKDYFLNYLIDESVDRLRYVFAPISQAELRALVTSGRSIRSCLSALHPIIYDEYPDGRIVNFGSIHGTIIPDQALPGRDVFLTDVPADEISKIFEFDISGFQFVLSGGRITRGIIPFTQYSEFLTNVQKLAIEVAAKIKSENNSFKLRNKIKP